MNDWCCRVACTATSDITKKCVGVSNSCPSQIASRLILHFLTSIAVLQLDLVDSLIQHENMSLIITSICVHCTLIFAGAFLIDFLMYYQIIHHIDIRHVQV